MSPTKRKPAAPWEAQAGLNKLNNLSTSNNSIKGCSEKANYDYKLEATLEYHTENIRRTSVELNFDDVLDTDADDDNFGEHEHIKTKGKLGNNAQTALHNGSPKRVLTMADLDREYALLVQEGSPSIYISRQDFNPISDTDLRRRLEDAVVQTGSKEGKASYTPAFKYWTGHANRHKYFRVAFTNKDIPTDTMNLFKGLGVIPKKGNCSKILDHIREVICSGNDKDFEAFINLIAWQIQNIGQPSRIVTVLRSEKHQIGKGIIMEMLAMIYGPSGFTAATTEQILGRFNTAIRGRAFIFLDEVLFSGDRKAADGIKSLSTSRLIGIEEKGLPIVQCPIAVNLWLASNHDNAANIEEHDARYWVLTVDPKRYGDTAYFKALLNEIENGGREAFAHHVLNLDVSDFVPSEHVPKDNAAKREMIRLSVNPYDARKWLEDCAHSERIIGLREKTDSLGMDSATANNNEYLASNWVKWNEGDNYEFGALAEAYREWQKGVKSPVAAKPTAIGNLGEVLIKAGLTRKQIRNPKPVWFSVLPSPSHCLELLWQERMSQPSRPLSQRRFND
jgi:hypothetical protein